MHHRGVLREPSGSLSSLILVAQTCACNWRAATSVRVYHMIYEGVNKEGVHALGLATSADGVEWERVGGKPIFERSPSSR